MRLPNIIETPLSKGGHIQGIALDRESGYIYCSFTTELLKLDLNGNLIGSVTNLVGHLGCIAFDSRTRRLYGSLELKHDSIGKGITNLIGVSLAEEDAFYIVSFDVDKIDRVGMHAERDGIMNATYLADVARDYAQDDEVSGKAHRYGCSGIDGITLCPAFDGSSDMCVTVAYGIYSDTDRADNDYQVLLQFSPEELASFARPLEQTAPHHSGEELSGRRCFFYTGNTSWGVQNLEYDPETKLLIFAVYPGKKEKFTPFRLFFAKADTAKESALVGRGGEVGLVLENAGIGEDGLCGIRGSFFPHGSTGICTISNGYFYISEPKVEKIDGEGKVLKLHGSTIRRYKLCANTVGDRVFE